MLPLRIHRFRLVNLHGIAMESPWNRHGSPGRILAIEKQRSMDGTRAVPTQGAGYPPNRSVIIP
jgi:hypothetical protein